MNNTIRRLSYYFRKVNAYNLSRLESIRGRIKRKPPATRPARLLAYKLALNARLEAERSAGSYDERTSLKLGRQGGNEQ